MAVAAAIGKFLANPLALRRNLSIFDNCRLKPAVRFLEQFSCAPKPAAVGEPGPRLTGGVRRRPKENIDKMLSRLPSSCRANAVWIVHKDQEPQLHSLAQTVGTGGAAVYAYATEGSPFSRLLGIPVVLAEQSPIPGAAVGRSD